MTTPRETPDGTPYGGDPHATPTGPQVPTTTREAYNMPSIEHNGEQWIRMVDHINLTEIATKEREEAYANGYKQGKFDAGMEREEAVLAAVNEIIQIAKACSKCGKPKHMHPHDFYDNALDCNCEATPPEKVTSEDDQDTTKGLPDTK